MGDIDFDLSPNGNCLGVAILDAFELADRRNLILQNSTLQNLGADLKEAHSVKDAVRILSLYRKPRLYQPDDMNSVTKFFNSVSGRLLGLRTVSEKDLSDGSVLLCLRSAFELYGIASAEGHWVTVAKENGQAFLHDRLWHDVENKICQAQQKDAQSVLNSLGVSLIL